QRKHQDAARTRGRIETSRLSKRMFKALLSSLRSAAEKLHANDVQTEWGEYYDDTNYTSETMQKKEALVEGFAESYLKGARVVHDLGANTGRFSSIIARHCEYVISHDVDEMAVERHYRT